MGNVFFYICTRNIMLTHFPFYVELNVYVMYFKVPFCFVIYGYGLGIKEMYIYLSIYGFWNRRALHIYKFWKYYFFYIFFFWATIINYLFFQLNPKWKGYTHSASIGTYIHKINMYFGYVTEFKFYWNSRIRSRYKWT